MLGKLAILGGLGYAGYKYYEKNMSGSSSRPAFAGNQGDATIRDSGPTTMRDTPQSWNKTDERLDESFPASDPPSTY